MELSDLIERDVNPLPPLTFVEPRLIEEYMAANNTPQRYMRKQALVNAMIAATIVYAAGFALWKAGNAAIGAIKDLNVVEELYKVL